MYIWNTHLESLSKFSMNDSQLLIVNLTCRGGLVFYVAGVAFWAALLY